jgi:hypothetical protein
MRSLTSTFDGFLGRGRAAVTVPALDGALKPNNALEEASQGISISEADNLVANGVGLLLSSGRHLLRIQPGSTPEIIFTADGDITAAAVSASGLIALASAPDQLSFLTSEGRLAAGLSSGSKGWVCVTALAFAFDGSLAVAIGSSKNGISDWQRDLLEGGRTGFIFRLDPSTGTITRIAAGLAYPNGLAFDTTANLIVSEAWKNQLIRLGGPGQPNTPVLTDLPGYPARLSGASRGGHWLSVFAPRSQLIEFVLREKDYRNAMMAEVDKAYWIAPSLRSGRSFHEPMQGGALKQMGILKPWAPTRSYGLVIELNQDFVPLRSFHSRAGGRRHGITSAAERNGVLYASSKGGDELVAVELTKREAS